MIYVTISKLNQNRFIKFSNWQRGVAVQISNCCS